jgi:hypothetical protein
MYDTTLVLLVTTSPITEPATTSHGKPTSSNRLRQTRLAGPPTRLQRTSEPVLRWDTEDTVGRVEVLDDDHLVAGRGALARGDDGPGEEEFPDLYRWLVLVG